MEVEVGKPYYGKDTGSSVAQGGVRQTIVIFEDRAVHNEFRSNADGIARYDMKCYIKKIPPGDKLVEIHRKATPKDFQQWPREYDAYKRGQTSPVTGTPIEMWQMLTPAQVFEFKAMNVFTVEQFAELPDGYGQKIMGFQGLKLKAQAFLTAAKGQGEVERLNAELAQRDERLAGVEKQLAELTSLLAAQHGAAKEPERQRQRELTR